MKTLFLNSACALFLTAFLCSCHNNRPQQIEPQLTQQQVNNGLIDSHKAFLRQQEDEIKEYIKRHGFDMQRTASGIYYTIQEHGKGEQAKVGEIATVSYAISLLDGTVCYNSKKDGPKQFKIGEDDVEDGVHEAVELMHVGDKGKFIIPTELANGLLGDRDKIPPGVPVIYDITLLSITQAKPALAK